jgi:tRNA-specific 2-thiouridylase
LGLAVADKHDSQDICFVPSGRYADVIERLKPGAAEAGAIVHIDGRVLGTHAGIIHYTVGQRRGIGVAVGEPLYVVHLDPAHRRVVVGPREALVTHVLRLRALNWIGEGSPEHLDGREAFARVRSTRPPVAAEVRVHGGGATVSLLEGEAGVAPGQACVLYDGPGAGARVLGGGFIERAERTGAAESALRALAAVPVEAVA